MLMLVFHSLSEFFYINLNHCIFKITLSKKMMNRNFYFFKIKGSSKMKLKIANNMFYSFTQETEKISKIVP